MIQSARRIDVHNFVLRHTQQKEVIMAIWDDVLTERDKIVTTATGYGKRQGYGCRPALLVVDVNYNFVGDYPEPIFASIKKYSNSCGEEGWEAIPRIQELLKVARSKNLPIFYSTGMPSQSRRDMGRWPDKHDRSSEDRNAQLHVGSEIVESIKPETGDVVIRKQKPSAFFGTTLMSYLTDLQVDTLIVAGTTTSGCVRATVIDAFSYNLRVALVEECVFDRMQVSHKINMFDMNLKYADVVSLQDSVGYINRLPHDLFAIAQPLE
jgi:maleamate amidohydrolase